MNHNEAIQYIQATLKAFGPGEAVTLTHDTWANLHAAMTALVEQLKPLTDEEIWDEVKAADLDWQTGWSLDEDASNRYITFARAIEAKLRSKNA